MQLKGTTIRIACVQGNPNSFVDVNGQVPVIPRSGRVQMPVSVFLGDPNVAANLETDLGNIATANLIVRQGGVTGTVLIEKVVPSSAFAAVTYEQWSAGADQILFTLSSTDTNWPAGPIWIALGVTTTDGDDVSLIYCSNASIRDYGIFNPGPPTAPDYTSYSKQESNARYLQAGAAVQWRPDLTGAAGTAGLATDLGSVDVASLPLYTTAVQIREHVTAPGLGVTGWVLELDTDARDGARECVAFSSIANGTPRAWRNRF